MYKYMSEDFFKDNKIHISKIDYENGNDSTIHTHDFIEIVYVCKGQGVHRVNDVSYNVRKGDLLFVNYGQPHSFIVGKNGMTIYNILMLPELFSTELLNSENAFELLSLTAFEEFANSIDANCPFVSLEGEEMKTVESLLVLLHDEFSSFKQGRHTMLNSLTMALMLNIFRAMSPDISKHQRHFSNVAEDILSYIETHYHEKISLNDLAERCFYTPSYFSKLFKDTYSMTITDYVMNIRIEKSLMLLKNSDMTVDDICVSVGYSDRTKFYKHFKERMGMTPAEYRKYCYSVN